MARVSGCRRSCGRADAQHLSRCLHRMLGACLRNECELLILRCELALKHLHARGRTHSHTYTTPLTCLNRKPRHAAVPFPAAAVFTHVHMLTCFTTPVQVPVSTGSQGSQQRLCCSSSSSSRSREPLRGGRSAGCRGRVYSQLPGAHQHRHQHRCARTLNGLPFPSAYAGRLLHGLCRQTSKTAQAQKDKPCALS